MSVDLTHAVRFDLPRGSVHGAGEERAVLVPASIFADLIFAAGLEVAVSIALQLGESMGRRVALRLGGRDGVRRAALEDMATALAAELSLAGLGALSLERWGKAMLFVIHNAPPMEQRFLPALFEGALASSTGSPAHCAVVASDSASVRILVGSATALDRVREWIAQGTGWAEAVARLQGDSR
jgi:hypothetical protein